MVIKFSVKNAFRKKGVAFLSSLGIGIGLMLMFVLGSFNEGVTAQLDDNFSKVLGIVQITEAEQVGSNSQLPLETLDNLLSSELRSEISNYNTKVELPALYTRYYGVDGRLPVLGDSLSIVGVNQSQDSIWGGATTEIQSGRIFESGQLEAIIDSRLIDQQADLGFNVSIGDNISLFLEYPNPSGQTVNLTIVGVYTQEDSGAPTFVPRSYYLYISEETAWTILQSGWAEPYEYFQFYTGIDLRFPATSSEEVDSYIERINALQTISTPLEVFSLAQFQESLADSLGIISTFTSVISAITALAGGMAIVVSQLNSVSQRKKEFAILKATGWRNGDIFKDIVYESLVLGILGAVIGLGLGIVLIQIFSSGVGPFSSIQAQVSGSLISNILIFALGIGTFGGLYPGYKAAKVRPVAVLKGE